MRVAERRHPIEHRVHRRHHVLAVDDDRLAPGRAQRHVQHRALFGDVDLVAVEHRVDSRAQPDLVGEREQQANRFVGDAMLGVVEVQARGLGGEPLAALGVLGEQGAQMSAADLFIVRLQCFPRRPFGEFGRCWHGMPPLFQMWIGGRCIRLWPALDVSRFCGASMCSMIIAAGTRKNNDAGTHMIAPAAI